ncbi:hypothetical protein [Aquirhabdus parva]|uniref:Uncharacterized protein n=1 Tax=Aquirhabdus parva TaxID=2283318 RepID=A0A345P959_9GAMM|nr:hypothetical protein [Aquirhabdus parva]AXI03818.1 hypothetical protein HYN46_13825 [Aquirhabdus parva]
MKEQYATWFPLGKDLPELDYVSIEINQVGALKLYLKKIYNSPSSRLNPTDRVVIEFAPRPISYRVGSESYRQRTLSALPDDCGGGNFFFSTHSYFLNDFYEDAGERHNHLGFEHLLIVTSVEVFDFIVKERPTVTILSFPED